MIRKVPEYHHEMQEEYALHYNLMCPVCREPFTENDVAEDIFLNQHFFRNFQFEVCYYPCLVSIY